MNQDSYSDEQFAGEAFHRDEPLRDEESVSRRLGELYQDLNDFTETKRKIEELIQYRQSLIDQEDTDFTVRSEEFRLYKSRAIEAIDHLFDACNLPKDKN